MFFQTSDTTWHAYNDFGGSDFYHGGGNGRAYKLSYNRPFATRGDNYGRDFLFSNEYPMIRFLERNGYDVSYTTGVDSDRRGHLIRNHKVFLSVGHDEYWSGTQRANVEAARDAGVQPGLLQPATRSTGRPAGSPAQDGSDTPYRTLVCYKETLGRRQDRPVAASGPAPGATPGSARRPTADVPENALAGTAYIANDTTWRSRSPPSRARCRFWRGTAVADLAPGQTATSPRTPSATSPTRTSTTASGRPG